MQQLLSTCRSCSLQTLLRSTSFQGGDTKHHNDTTQHQAHGQQATKSLKHVRMQTQSAVPKRERKPRHVPARTLCLTGAALDSCWQADSTRTQTRGSKTSCPLERAHVERTSQLPTPKVRGRLCSFRHPKQRAPAQSSMHVLPNIRYGVEATQSPQRAEKRTDRVRQGAGTAPTESKDRPFCLCSGQPPARKGSPQGECSQQQPTQPTRAVQRIGTHAQEKQQSAHTV